MHSHFSVHLHPILFLYAINPLFSLLFVPTFLVRLCLYSLLLSITLLQPLNEGIWGKETTALQRLARYAKKLMNFIKILENKVGKGWIHLNSNTTEVKIVVFSVIIFVL